MIGHQVVGARWGPVAGAVATGVSFALAAPPIGAWPLAFVCLTPLLAACRGRATMERLRLGGLAGAVAAALTVVGPLGLALARFFEAPAGVAFAVSALVGGVFGGGGFALFAALAGDSAAAGPWVATLRAAAAWVVADAFRSSLFTGLPWLLLGHLLAPVPALAQLAAWGGVAMLSFWVACASGAILALLTRERRVSGVAMLCTLAVVGAAAAWRVPVPEGAGTVTLAGEEPRPEGSLRVALVQPALPPDWRSDPARVGRVVDELVRLTAEAGPVDLAVWPENAIPVLLPANRGLVGRALGSIEDPPRWLLLGAPHAERDRPGAVHNAALLFDRDGRLVAAHDKVRLVPFTEYVPLGLAGTLLDPGSARLTAGDDPRALPLDGFPALGPLVCYEMLFADVARDLVAQGAGTLINLSNDAWFGGTAGAEQHATAAILRAIELRRPVLRATSDGLTFAVDARGNVIGSLPAREAGVLRVDVRPSAFHSGGQRLGPWGAAGAVALLLAIGCVRWWRNA